MANNRHCGECTLCCRLLPVPTVPKGAHERCRHQGRTGCAIYTRRPRACELWSCLWLLGEDTGPRPDRAHLVVDVSPDFIDADDKVTGEQSRIIVTQVWLDPAYPSAHTAPAFRQWLDKSRRVALVRGAGSQATVLVPPSCNSEGRWWTIEASEGTGIHTPADIAAALLAAKDGPRPADDPFFIAGGPDD
jgi:hypothetical protein